MRVATFRTTGTAGLAISALLLAAWLPRPTNPAHAGEVALASACPTASSVASAFPDVVAGDTHAATITCLHAWHIVRGGTDGMFRPAATATRAHFAIALHALLEGADQAPVPPSRFGFTDVGSTHPGRDAIAALTGAGIIHGTTATTFEPNAPIERAQMASLLARSYDRVFGQTMPQGPSFPDTVGTTHETSIRQLVGGKITVGYADGTFRPTASLTRAQMASFLARYLDRLVVEGAAAAPAAEELRTRRASGPARTIVEDAQGAWVATFTDGARTVALAGPARRFDEATATNGVTSRTWVRVLPSPFDGRFDPQWLADARADRSPDVLAASMEYLAGAPDTFDESGVLVSGDAAYGPLRSDGRRPVGSDWHDFQGVHATDGSTIGAPRADRYQSLDCSGYVRMLFGVRFGVPMSRPADGGASLPRTSRDQAAAAPGVVPYPNRGTQITSFDRLQPGDLVFQDATSDSANAIDHVGIYLGPDDAGRHRFISSRRSINGPTMGDFRGPSLLDGTGLFARSFRSTRRL